MSDRAVDRPEGVLISGAFGTGKSSVAEEMSTLLEARGVPYAAIDLDWLAWFDTGSGDEAEAERVHLENVGAVVGNYLAVGVRRFVLAGWVPDQADLDRLGGVLPFPVTVVELRAPWATIARRLRASPASGRLDDLRRARSQVEPGHDAARPDATIDGDRPLGDVASDILRLLRW